MISKQLLNFDFFDRKANFLTCFLALLIYKYLEKKVNRADKETRER